MGILVILTLFFASYCFTTSPASWFDEGMYYQIAKNVATDGVWGIQLAPGNYKDISLISVGYSVFYPGILAFKIFGDSIATLRLVAILFLLGCVLTFYALARKLYGAPSAFWSTLFLITFSPLYGNGKNFLGEVPGLFYFFLGLLLLTSLPPLGKKRVWCAILGGVILGLGASAKSVYLLMVPAVGIAYLFRYLRKELPTREERLTPLFVALGMTGALLVFVFTQFGGPGGFSGVSTHYVNPYYVQDITSVVISNLKRFVTESTPIHFLLLSVVSVWFFAGKLKKREPIALAETAVVIFALLITTSYLRTAGWYRYFFPAHAVLFLFLAPGLMAFGNRFNSHVGRFGRTLLIASFVLVVCIQLVPLKQETLRSCDSDAPTDVEPFMNALPKTSALFFYNLPQVAARYSGKNFYQYMKMSEALVWGKENEALLQKGAFDYLFVAHNISEEIGRIPACFHFEKSIHQVLVYKRTLALSCDI